MKNFKNSAGICSLLIASTNALASTGPAKIAFYADALIQSNLKWFNLVSREFRQINGININ